MTPIPVCRCCGAPLDVQAMPDKPWLLLATCWTPTCKLRRVTLSPDELAALTPREIAAYGRMNDRRDVSKAAFAQAEAARQARRQTARA